QPPIPIEDPQLNYALKNEALEKKVGSLLTRKVTQILKITQHKIEGAKNLGDYGMDSIHAIELAKQISEYYQIVFTPAVFYTHSTILTISQYIVAQFLDAASTAHQTVASLPANRNVVKITRFVETQASQDIAIIGMHGLFPQSDDLNSFWEHLIAGHDLVSEIPPERWNWHDYYSTNLADADKSNSKWGGFINNIDQFDASFFNISAREANLMDPQQRLFLESVWNTIEDAGYDPFKLPNQKVGVFAGVEFNDYNTLIGQRKNEFHGFIATGNSHSMLANRVSYFFNFQGPSEVVDTACSSSLVAIHRAVQALRYGECDIAIAGGVSLMINPDTQVVTSQLGALSGDGRCKTFDKSANGYVKGEGIGSLFLKPLNQAQIDGDHIYGIIKASAVNHGGKAQSLTAPNAKAQSDLLINAYTQANIDLDTISYIETHGTGTALGDPVEIEGLKQAFGVLLGEKYKDHQIGLGSVKTNIGHLEPASGIAGVMKLILAMSHKQLPGILHFNELNPFIDFKDTPFYLVKETQAWTRLTDKKGIELPLRAGVSSFGFGGTNAHLVIEEGIGQQKQMYHAQKPYYLITLSAKKNESLLQKITDLLHWLARQKDPVSLMALSFTLSVGRAHFNYRSALVVQSVDELIQALTLLVNLEIPEYYISNEGQTCSMQGPVFDEIYQSAINGLLRPEDEPHYRHKLYILADLYTKHYDIEWDKLFAGQLPQRIAALPSYPFIKKRYWFDLELITSQSQKSMTPNIITKIDQTIATDEVLAYLQAIFAEKLGTLPEQIDIDETYEVYGVDSLIGLEITNRLEKDFGSLPKTLLYERNRLIDLAKYFLKNHNEQLPLLISTTAIMTSSVFEESEVKPIAVIDAKSDIPALQDIAIIGLSGTFPMANTMDEFWHNLTTSRDCVGEVPLDRWNYKDYPVVVGGEEKFFPHGGFIPDVDKFDPLFFNISPRDAGLMDPQERLFMQSVWSTLEDAGYTREKLKRNANNSVGVFAGVTYNFYPLFIAEEWQKGNQVPLDVQSFSLANRISYFLNLNGPSFVVDTACSSSLAAIHLACESIRRGDCTMAIAGGVNLSLHPSKYHFLGSFSFMSEKGRCASFAEGGTGYVPSEGVGSVLLKP
ncbi:MAG: beta-ketoacyl synthase N-terminal-like domain-containing protein, partial [bacterium]|nr:beta-ketoacyl synthase N-terminal-like domain-containing protein [bacterium]